MAERASHASKPSESDFHDSHPLDDDLMPSLGDLSDIDSLPESKASKSQSVGDLNSVAAQEDDDVLGDITLLEEAFAEMGDDEPESADIDMNDAENDIDVDIASKLKTDLSIPDTDEGIDEFNIPVLSDEVDEPTSDSEPSNSLNVDQSIPVLEEKATIFTASSAIPDNDSALDQLLDTDQKSNAKKEDFSSDASVFLEPEEDGEISISQFDPTATSFAEINTHSDVQTAVDSLSDSDIADVTDSDVMSGTVDDKIAQLAANSVRAQNEINDDPLTLAVSKFDLSEVTEDPYSDLPTDFADGLNSAPLSSVSSVSSVISQSSKRSKNDKSSAKSRFDTSQVVSQPSHTEHTVQVGDKSGFSLNIPFELHTQLSKKIDALVIEATTSLTHELHDHLNDRLEILLGQAVEAVLPNLVDQMLNGLRKEVKLKVKQQLPVIINEVLGKTSLKDK